MTILENKEKVQVHFKNLGKQAILEALCAAIRWNGIITHKGSHFVNDLSLITISDLMHGILTVDNDNDNAETLLITLSTVDINKAFACITKALFKAMGWYGHISGDSEMPDDYDHFLIISSILEDLLFEE